MEWLNDICEGDDFKFHVLCKRWFLYKNCKNWPRGYPDNYRYNNGCGFRGDYGRKLSCSGFTLVYHGCHNQKHSNWYISGNITCILTWNSTYRRCEKACLLWFSWRIHARCKAFVYFWNSFLWLKEKTIVYWCWAEPISTCFITQHSSTRLFLVSFTKSLEVPWLEINVCFFDMLYVWKCTLRSVLQTVQREYKLV